MVDILIIFINFYFYRQMDNFATENFQSFNLKSSHNVQEIIMKAIKENKDDYYKNRKGLNKRISDLEASILGSESIFQQTITKRKIQESSKSSKSRGSRFRGVSKNGAKHQVFIMINKKKRFIGVFKDEEEAARIYDKLAIIFHGHKVNF